MFFILYAYTECFKIKCKIFGSVRGIDKLRRKVLQKFTYFCFVLKKIVKKKQDKQIFTKKLKTKLKLLNLLKIKNTSDKSYTAWN